MFCVNCGNELPDGVSFCRYCGAKQDNIPTNPVKNRDKKILIILACIIGVLLVVAGIGVAFLVVKPSPEVEVVSDEQTQLAEDSLTIEGTEELDNPGQDDDALEEEYIEPTALYISTPCELTPIRKTPGEGSDIVTEIGSGIYLEWFGETKTKDDKKYLKIKVKDSGEEGYIDAKECVIVDFIPDMEELNIVSVENTIYTYDMMVDDIYELCSTYPDLMDYLIIGQSADYRDIYAIEFGNPNADRHILMQASMHAREYVTTQLVMKMLEYYAYYYDTGTYNGVTYRELFDDVCLHIVPMVNPDGVVIATEGVYALNDYSYIDTVYECYERDKYDLMYEEDANGYYSWTDNYKDDSFVLEESENPTMITFEEYQTIWKANAAGVDLNKNFDAYWEELQCRDYPSFSAYRGESPASEPETQALIWYAISYNYECYISYHSMGGLIYYDVNGNTDENSEASTELAENFADWLSYKTSNTKSAYNISMGGFNDWVQLVLSKPGVTIESGKMPCPTQPEEFPSIWYRHRETWAKLCDN